MAVCIKCGKEAETCLCDRCRNTVDVEMLCNKIISYRPGSGENPLWDSICSGLFNPYDFKFVVFALSDELPTPRKEYLRVLSIAGASQNVPKDSRRWSYVMFKAVRDSEGLTEAERNRLAGIALEACYTDYEYEKAEEIASALCKSEDLPWQAGCSLANFYIITRRYDSADKVIAETLSRFAGNDNAVQKMNEKADYNAKQRAKADAGKNEYLPKGEENRKHYIDFLASIGKKASVPVPSIRSRKAKNAIPRDQYPVPVEIRDTDFDTFVAFDLETTGIRTDIDSIIDIGAVKVVNGQVADSAEFTFQELVQPLDNRKISEKITALTGITNEEAYAARPIWEVLPDFMNFAGDDSVLVGFNCMAFDSKFMVRAGRYSNYIIENRYFDVMRYASQFKDKLGIESRKVSLEELSEKLEIENPRAHRALADALTTARIFLKLKEFETEKQSITIDDLLSDIDNW